MIGTIDNPIGMAKALIRPMIKAPDGWNLIVSDYSGIENRLLAWLAGDTQTILDFANGINQYVTMAAARYHEPYDTIQAGYKAGDPKYFAMRQMGKVIILGCGYQMGAAKFKETAWLQFGLEVTLEEAKEAVKAYRAHYHLIVDLWDGLKKACARCVLSGQKQTYNKITFGLAKVNGVRWLAMLLPSGKSIYYPEPQVKQLFIKDYEYMGTVPTVTHMGTDPYTKKWVRLRLTPGRITENATQGTAREVMGLGMQNIHDYMKEVDLIASVHDEALGLIREEDTYDNTLEIFNDHLCNIDWCPDAQLAAEGWIGKRYRK